MSKIQEIHGGATVSFRVFELLFPSETFQNEKPTKIAFDKR